MKAGSQQIEYRVYTKDVRRTLYKIGEELPLESSSRIQVMDALTPSSGVTPPKLKGTTDTPLVTRHESQHGQGQHYEDCSPTQQILDSWGGIPYILFDLRQNQVRRTP